MFDAGKRSFFCVGVHFSCIVDEKKQIMKIFRFLFYIKCLFNINKLLNILDKTHFF